MKFSNRTLLALLMVITSSQLSANTSGAPEPDIVIDGTTNIDQRKAIITTIKAAIDEQLELLASKLQETVQMINNNIVQVANKQELRQSIGIMCNLITQTRGLLLSDLNDEGLALVIAATNDLTVHINEALDKGFTELPPFKLQDTIDRATKRGGKPTIDSMKKALDANKKLQEKFTSKISSLGLNLPNKAYRKFNKFVLEPFAKNNVAYWTTGAAALTSIPFTLWFESQNSSPKGLRDFFGYAWDQVTEEKDGIKRFVQDPEKKPLKALGNLEGVIRSFNAGQLALLAVLLPYALPTIKDSYKSSKTFVQKHALRAHNFMMGGIYKTRTVKLTNQLNDIEPRLALDDLIGLHHIKSEFSRIVDYFEAPERFATTGVEIPKGYLLTGKTRTGKSWSVEALVGSIKAMLKRNGRDEKEINYVFITPETLQYWTIPAIADWAQNHAPCIIFFDEIDMLGLQRSRDSRLLSEFLTAMSGVMNGDPQKPILWFAATNKDENLDDALKQHGRLGKELHFEYPSLAERAEFIHRELEKLGADIEAFDIISLGRLTNGHSFQSINTMLHAARFAALRAGQPLTQMHVQEALNTVLRHMIPANYDTLAQDERHILAVHWAGHALARMLLPVKAKLAEVTIRPLLLKPEELQVWERARNKQKVMYGSVFTYTQGDSRNIITQQEAIDTCKIMLAGKAAEQILLGTTSNCHHDAQAGLYAARDIVLENMDFSQLPPELQNKYTADALKLKDMYYQEVVKLLESNKEKLVLMAQVLEHFSSLTEGDINFLFTQEGKEFFLHEIAEIEQYKAKKMADLQKSVEQEEKERQEARAPQQPKPVKELKKPVEKKQEEVRSAQQPVPAVIA